MGNRGLEYENAAQDWSREGYADESRVKINEIPIFSRVVVLDVINDPYSITQDKLEYYEREFGLQRANIGKVIPRNTILGRKILTADATKAEPPIFLFPFFPPHLSLPCNPGEHVWALIHHEPRVIVEHGYWFCRIVEYGFVDDVNHTHAPRAFENSFFPSTEDKRKGKVQYNYEFLNGVAQVDENGERITREGTEFIKPRLKGTSDDAYVDLVKQSGDVPLASRIVSYSAVPRYFKRPGDVVLEGSNNSLVVLGTERQGRGYATSSIEFSVENEEKNLVVPFPVFPEGDLRSGTEDPFGDKSNKIPPGASIDMVVGRGQTGETSGPVVTNSLGYKELDKAPANVSFYEREGDPDLKNDRSRIRLSENTKVDANLGILNFNSTTFSIEDDASGSGAIVIKTDKLRLVARQDVEILVTSSSLNPSGTLVDSDTISSYAAVVIKANGDIIFRPSSTGYIKLGGNDADKALLCTDYPATQNNGTVTAVGPKGAVIVTTDASSFGDGSVNQGTIASKILVK